MCLFCLYLNIFKYHHKYLGTLSGKRDNNYTVIYLAITVHSSIKIIRIHTYSTAIVESWVNVLFFPKHSFLCIILLLLLHINLITIAYILYTMLPKEWGCFLLPNDWYFKITMLNLFEVLICIKNICMNSVFLIIDIILCCGNLIPFLTRTWNTWVPNVGGKVGKVEKYHI